MEHDEVYVGEVRDAILQAESAGAELPTISLSVEYLRNVRHVSDQRILAAGVRLAKLLEVAK